ncbi:MAG: TlpA family protein disulfide reductase [Gammaproteobacteria bacterium]|nr:TlpA family protein disulfide reductase [Gammaproteobacteria bacterium]
MQNAARIRSILLTLLLTFSAATMAEETDSAALDLSQYQGDVVVLDFWASWCGPCRRSFPWLNEMHTKYQQDGLVVIGVNLDARQEDAAEFLEDYPAAFKIHFDTDATLAFQYGIQAMPSSVVIGRDGEIRASHSGFKVKQQDEYEAILVDALGEKP